MEVSPTPVSGPTAAAARTARASAARVERGFGRGFRAIAFNAPARLSFARAHSSANHITLRAGAGAAPAPGGSNLFVAPALPSDANPEHAYGKSSLVPSAEERAFGAYVPMMAIVNGAFADEWARYNESRADELKALARKPRPKPRTTRAAEARAAAAAAKTAPVPKPAPFKMKLFENVQSKFRE